MKKASYPNRIYLSASWKPDDRPLTERIANLIASCGVTVVRDHQDNKNENPVKAERTWAGRIDSMMRDCAGLVVVLTYNRKSPQTTSPYLIPELLAADAQGIPILLFANPGVELFTGASANNRIEFRFPNATQQTPLLQADEIFRLVPSEQLAMEVLLGNAGGFFLTKPHNVKGPFPYPNTHDQRATEAAIEDFAEACPARDPYPFVFNVLPFSLKDSIHQTIATEVFKATGMACHISLDSITGETSVRRNWELMLQRSDLIIAELSSLRDTCLFETGCAIGFGKRVFILSKKGQQALPFGLDDRTFYQYGSTTELAEYVRETCCSAHRREVFNLSPEFKRLHSGTEAPGIPSWLNQGSAFSLDSRLTVSIWAICLSIAFAVQNGVKLIWPASPTPNILAVLSALFGFLALTRVGREFWEKKIGRSLSWLPWIGIASVVILFVFLATLIAEKQKSPEIRLPTTSATVTPQS